MLDNISTNSYFQDNTVLDVVCDISKDIMNYKNQFSTTNFNNLSLVENKLYNIQTQLQFINNRIDSETNGIYNACQNQFESINKTFTTQK